MKVTHRFVIVTSTLLAIVVGVWLLLRPARTIRPGPEMVAAERLTPAVRAVVRSMMLRHGEQMSGLVLRVVVLDYDGIARTAGEIFDEPTLARPVAGDELNAALPPRFFELQDALRAGAKQLVETAAVHDGPRLSDSLRSLVATCMQCHDLYLHGEPTSPPRGNPMSIEKEGAK